MAPTDFEKRSEVILNKTLSYFISFLKYYSKSQDFCDPAISAHDVC